MLLAVPRENLFLLPLFPPDVDSENLLLPFCTTVSGSLYGTHFGGRKEWSHLSLKRLHTRLQVMPEEGEGKRAERVTRTRALKDNEQKKDYYAYNS